MKHLLTTFIFMVIILVTSSLALLFTEWGTRQLLVQGLHLAGNPIQLGEINGSLGRSLRLRNITFQQGDTQVQVELLTLQWTPEQILQGRLHIDRLLLQGISAALPGSSEQDSSPEFAGIHIPLAIRCNACRLERIRLTMGEIEQHIDFVEVVAEINHQKVSIEQLAVALPEPDFRLTANGSARLEPLLPFQLDAEWQGRHPQSGPVQGHSHVNGNLQQITLASNTRQPFNTGLDGDIWLAQKPGETHRFELKGQWQQVQWPIMGTPDTPVILSPGGQVLLAGTAEKFSISLQTQVRQPQIPDASIQLEAVATPTSLLESKTRIITREGSLNARASADWQNPEAIRLQLDSQGKNFNPGVLNRELPGNLDFSARVDGSLQAGLFFGHATLETLSGQLRDYPLSGKGEIDVQGEALDVHNLSLRSGPNELEANGKISREMANLAYRLKAPSLEAAWPGLTGQLNTEGTVRGTLYEPSISATLAAENIRFDSLALRRANGRLLLSPSGASEVTLEISDLSQGQQQIRHLALEAEGTFEQHSTRVAIRGDQGSIATQLNGSWIQQAARWQGQISQTTLDSAAAGTWQQTKPAQLVMLMPPESLPAVTLENFCLRNNGASLCTSASRSEDGNLSTNAEITAFPLSLLPANLPEAVNLQGSISGNIKVRGKPEDLQADASITHDPGSQVTFTQEQLQKQLPLAGSTLLASMHSGAVNARIELADNDLLSLWGQAHIEQTPGYPIRGELHLRMDDLGIISTLAPEVTPVEGYLNTDVAIAGTLEKPVIIADASLREARIGIQPLGITLEKIALTAKPSGAGDQLDIEAVVTSGEGTLTARGDIGLAGSRAGSLQLTVTGSDFQVIRLPEAQASISPELTVNASSEKIRVTGKVKIPHARIEVQDLPENTVTVSRDEVIITANDTGNSQFQRKGPDMEADVSVILGSDIQFSGKGLSTGMSGTVRVRQNNDAIKVNGILNTQNGMFETFGQKLTISTGEFQFNGPPDNPWIHVVASRQARNRSLTAYVTVEGPLQSAQTKISSSDPNMSEQEALAYLVTGKSISGLEGSDRSTLASAAMAFGAEKVAWLTDLIGLDEFAVQEGNTLDDTMMALGAHLLPGFYVGVNVGLFNHQEFVVIRKDITEHINIEGESGESQRIELNYSIDYECLWQQQCDGDTVNSD